MDGGCLDLVIGRGMTKQERFAQVFSTFGIIMVEYNSSPKVTV